jgi:hypothetical protein
MVSQVESCYSDAQDYTKCDTAGELGNTGLTIGGLTGQVSVTGGTDTYVIVGHSKSNNNFTITKGTDGAVTRSCTTAGTGSCLSGTGTGTW